MKTKIYYLIMIFVFATSSTRASQNEQIQTTQFSQEEQKKIHLSRISLIQKHSLEKKELIYTWYYSYIFQKYLISEGRDAFQVRSIRFPPQDWATKKNKNHLKEIFDIENYMIGQLIDYYADFYLGNGRISENIPMNNRMGYSSQHECQITGHLHPLYFLKYHSPQESKVVVDIGSGWGTCAKLMAHLGYKVYSVDIDAKHLEYQKEHFCDIPDKDSFLSFFWQRNNPELLKADNFLRHCRTAQNNITYIQGDFADASTVSKLKDQNWDIVIATDSMQFMESDQRGNVLNTIKEHLKPEGSFVLTINHNSDIYNQHSQSYSNPIAYNFSLEEVYEQYFDLYKILTLWIDDKQRLNGYTLKKP